MARTRKGKQTTEDRYHLANLKKKLFGRKESELKDIATRCGFDQTEFKKKKKPQLIDYLAVRDQELRQMIDLLQVWSTVRGRSNCPRCPASKNGSKTDQELSRKLEEIKPERKEMRAYL